MKRDMDLVKDLLLQIEAKADGRQSVDFDLGEWSTEQVADHLLQLQELNFVSVLTRDMQTGMLLITRMTSRGHDFLDSIRDPDIWAKTKERASAAGGFTVELLGEIAKGLIKTKIKQHTGIEL